MFEQYYESWDSYCVRQYTMNTLAASYWFSHLESNDLRRFIGKRASWYERLGVSALHAMVLDESRDKAYKVYESVYLGFTGFYTDSPTPLYGESVINLEYQYAHYGEYVDSACDMPDWLKFA